MPSWGQRESVTFCDLKLPFWAQNFPAPDARWPTRRERNGDFVREFGATRPRSNGRRAVGGVKKRFVATPAPLGPGRIACLRIR
jgi:hypothetical protein